MNALPNRVTELTRRISRKLQVQTGLMLSYDDLALLVATGAFKALQAATETELEEQCLSHLNQPPDPKPLRSQRRRSTFAALTPS